MRFCISAFAVKTNPEALAMTAEATAFHVFSPHGAPASSGCITASTLVGLMDSFLMPSIYWVIESAHEMLTVEADGHWPWSSILFDDDCDICAGGDAPELEAITWARK